MLKKKTRIKVGSVSIPFYQWTDNKSGKHYWRWSWKDTTGKWKYGTRASKEEAVEAARAQCRLISAGNLDLTAITSNQADLCRQFLALNPTSEDIRKLRESRVTTSATLAVIITAWHGSKLAENHGKESPHLRNVRQWLEKLAIGIPEPANGITAAQLASHIETASENPKSRRDSRARIVALWKFARTHDLLTSHEAEKLPTYRAAVSSTVTLWTPHEMQALLHACTAEFLPWLVLAAFSGLRSEEISPKIGTKPPLKWENIKRSQGVIDLPAASSKVRKRRLIPITPTLEAWLDHISPPKSGVICPRLPAENITKSLGASVAGWRKNALRHSYGSYRAAQTKDLQALAIEMGTSYPMIEKHYREAVSEADALAFWSLKPSEVFKKLLTTRSKSIN